MKLSLLRAYCDCKPLTFRRAKHPCPRGPVEYEELADDAACWRWSGVHDLTNKATGSVSGSVVDYVHADEVGGTGCTEEVHGKVDGARVDKSHTGGDLVEGSERGHVAHLLATLSSGKEIHA